AVQLFHDKAGDFRRRVAADVQVHQFRADYHEFFGQFGKRGIAAADALGNAMPLSAGVMLPGVEQDWFWYLVIRTILRRRYFHECTLNAPKREHMSRNSGIWPRKTKAGIVYY